MWLACAQSITNTYSLSSSSWKRWPWEQSHWRIALQFIYSVSGFCFFVMNGTNAKSKCHILVCFVGASEVFEISSLWCIKLLLTGKHEPPDRGRECQDCNSMQFFAFYVLVHLSWYNCTSVSESPQVGDRPAIDSVNNFYWRIAHAVSLGQDYRTMRFHRGVRALHQKWLMEIYIAPRPYFEPTHPA